MHRESSSWEAAWQGSAAALGANHPPRKMKLIPETLKQ